MKKEKTIRLSEATIREINNLPLNIKRDSFSARVEYLIEKQLLYSPKGKHKTVNNNNKLRFVDLFAGIGGIRLGFQGNSNNTKCVYSSEWDRFAQKTYEANFNELPQGDITKVKAKDIPNFDVLLAGFPCQPFSSIGKREGFENVTQGTLFFDVLRIIKYHRPASFLLENVPGILTIQHGNTFKIIKTSLENSGYNVYFKLLNAADFDLAQDRKRVVIVGFRKDLDSRDFKFPNSKNKKHYINEILEYNPSGYSISKHLQKNYLFKKDDGHPLIVDHNSKRLAKTLNASYHKIQRITGTFVKEGETGLRLLSAKECKRLQGFPENFKIPVSRTQMYRQFGNSVAVPMIKAVSDEIKIVLDKNKELLNNEYEQTKLFKI